MNFNDLKNDLKNYPENKIVFVGLGNSMRQDDSAGLIFTRKLKDSTLFPDAKFVFAHSTPENYLNHILSFNPALVVFIDAAKWGGKPGEIAWIENGIIENLGLSTHTYSISLFEKYLKLDNDLEVKYLTIQPLYMEFSTPISKKVTRGINRFFNSI